MKQIRINSARGMQALACAGLAIGMSASLAQAQSSFKGLGQLPGSEGNLVYDISGDGKVVAGALVYSGFDRAFRWTEATGIVNLGAMPGGAGGSTGAYSLNFDGSVMVGAGVGAAAAWEAFRWTQATGLVGLGDLPGGTFYSVANACSSDGSIIAGIGDFAFNPNPPYTPTNGQAFRWTQGSGMVGQGDLPGGILFSAFVGSSADGSVLVGHGTTAAGDEMMRWTQGTGMVSLGDLPGGITDASAASCSSNGSVIVGWASDDEGYHAVRWTQATGIVKLGKLTGPPFANDDFALDCSGDGSIVVGAVKVQYDDPFNFGYGRAFIWDAVNGMRDLRDVLIFEHGLTNLDAWQLTIASAISTDGKTILGNGFNPEGKQEAWIAHLSDSPGTCYADCDGDGLLTIDDFICFQTMFAIGC